MRISTLLGSVLFLLSVGPVHAGTLGSAFLSGGGATEIDCLVSNIGTTPVDIVSVRIFNLSGADITTSTSCGPSLTAGRTCIVDAVTVGGRAVIEVVGSTKNLRGSCELFSSATLLAVTDMH